MPTQLWPFLAVAGVLTLTPGPDMALVLRNGLRGGPVDAWWTGLGCCAGITLYAAASAAGLAAVLAASPAAFAVLRYAGAAYLVWLGVLSLVRSRTGSPPSPLGGGGAPAPDRRRSFREGLLSNLFNPKIMLIFLTVIPQFVAPGEASGTVAVLAGAFLLIAVVWWRCVSLAVGRIGRLLSRRGVRTGVELTVGVVLIGLGLRVALIRS